MKKLLMVVVAILLSFTVISAIVKTTDKTQAEANDYTDSEIERIKKLVKPSKVCAIINKDCIFFDNLTTLKAIGTLKNNTVVEILQDKSCKYYYVREDENSKAKWVSADCLTIPPDEKTNSEKMSSSDLEAYVNIMNFKSNTPYLIWVDIDRQLTHIFKNEKNNWSLDRSFTCATGKNVSPTTRGEFETSDKGEWFYSERLKSGAKYYIRFNNSYLFHSVAMDKNQNVTDPVLGKRRSSGCVRLSVDDIKYLYKTIPEKTKVYIN